MKMIRFTTTTVLIAASLAIHIFAQTAQTDRRAEAALQAAINKEVVDGNLETAIKQYKDVEAKYPQQRAVVADALLRMAEAYQKLGDMQSRRIFERVISEFSDQKDARARAQERLTELSSKEHSKQAAREIWSGSLKQLRGALPSPDGRYLTTVDTKTGDLAVRDLTRNSTRLFNKPTAWEAYVAEAVISPDSREVAYSWYDDTKPTVELRIASIVADEPVRTTTLTQGEYFGPQAWTPDGKQLVVTHSLPDGTGQLGIYTIQTRSFRSIKSLEWRRPGKVSLSPDGRYIAYDMPANDRDSPPDIFILKTDGGGEFVVRHPAGDNSPVWSPDGKNIIFLSNRSGKPGLWILPVKDGQPDGTAAEIKIATTAAIQIQGLTRDGTLFYVDPMPNARPNLFTTTLDAAHASKPATPLTERELDSNLAAAWSPDGKYLAYYSFRSNDVRKIVIRSETTGDEQTIQAPARITMQSSGPRWFPDNRSLLVAIADAQGRGFGLYRLSIDTGNTEQLLHLPVGINAYDLSRDGRTIFYAGIDSSGVVVRYDIESRRETELAKYRDYALSLAVSGDGTRLAMNHIGGAVDVMSTAGGPSRVLFKPNPGQIGTGTMREGVTWAHDGRFVLFVQDDGELYSVPAAGGAIEKVGISIEGNIKSPIVHPNGKQLIFSVLRQGSAKMFALDNFLPKR